MPGFLKDCLIKGLTPGSRILGGQDSEEGQQAWKVNVHIFQYLLKSLASLLNGIVSRGFWDLQISGALCETSWIRIRMEDSDPDPDPEGKKSSVLLRKSQLLFMQKFQQGLSKKIYLFVLFLMCI